MEIHEGIASFRATGAALNLTHYLPLLAHAHDAGGDVGKALDVLGEAFALRERGGERWWEAELYRSRGVLRSRGAPGSIGAAARKDVQRALVVARQRRSRSLEARAAASLAALLPGRTTLRIT